MYMISGVILVWIEIWIKIEIVTLLFINNQITSSHFSVRFSLSNNKQLFQISMSLPQTITIHHVDN